VSDVKVCFLTLAGSSMRIFMTPLMRALHEAGYDVHMVTSPGPELLALSRDPAWTAHAMALPRAMSPLVDLTAIMRLRAHFARQRYTVVHAHMNKCGFLATIAARLAEVPIRIYHNHGLAFLSERNPVRTILARADRLTCRLATRVLYVSPSNRDDAVRLGICAAEKAGVLANGSICGLDTARFADRASVAERGREVRGRLGIPPDAIVVGYVGQAVRHKGFHLLVETWRRHFANDPSLRLLMLGVTEAEVKRLLGPPPAGIIAPGFVENPEAYYGAMDLVVLPSEREGLGYALLEGAATQLPTVATAIPGIVDAVEDGRTGILVPSRSPAALARAIRRLAADPGLRWKMGQAGRERVMRLFPPRLVLDALVDEYENLLAARGIPPPSRAGSFREKSRMPENRQS
jgi:glycosyltransferase involved in cell wall biosynthesis